jgi:predicted DNA-binding ribbon-helix-helix protein
VQSTIKKRSVILDGHKTSVSLEDDFLDALKEIAKSQQTALSVLIAQIEAARGRNNLSSAIRIFILDNVDADDR